MVDGQGCSGMVTVTTPTGTFNVGGMAGWTGMAGYPGSSPPSCCVCKGVFSQYTYLNIDFRGGAVTAGEFYRVCKDCVKETRKLLKKIKVMEMRKLPLHINHENIFVKEAVKNRLAGKWLCKV